MLAFLQKHISPISILFLIATFTALLFYPTSSRAVSTVVISFCISTAVAFTVHGNWEKHEQGNLTRPRFFRNTGLDLLGLALTMGAAMYVGRLAGGFISPHAGLWIGLFAGFIGGFIASWGVRSAWGRITKNQS